jgi:hypothetical protein
MRYPPCLPLYEGLKGIRAPIRPWTRDSHDSTAILRSKPHGVSANRVHGCGRVMLQNVSRDPFGPLSGGGEASAMPRHVGPQLSMHTDSTCSLGVAEGMLGAGRHTPGVAHALLP